MTLGLALALEESLTHLNIVGGQGCAWRRYDGVSPRGEAERRSLECGTSAGGKKDQQLWRSASVRFR